MGCGTRASTLGLIRCQFQITHTSESESCRLDVRQGYRLHLFANTGLPAERLAESSTVFYMKYHVVNGPLGTAEALL